MRKKLILFGATATVLAGTFGGISYFRDQPLWPKPPVTPSAVHFTPPTNNDIMDFKVEGRDPDGHLEYLFTAAKMKPLGRGIYLLDHPTATYYTKEKDPSLMVVTAESGSVVFERLPANLKEGMVPAQKPMIKEGTLTKNVRVTYGPADSFVAGSTELQPGQIRATFDDDIHLNYAERTLDSKGAVHVRGDVRGIPVAVDGSGMTLTFNTNQKRIEFLRLEQWEKIVLRDVMRWTKDGSTKDGSGETGKTAPAGGTTTTTAVAGTQGNGGLAAVAKKAADLPTAYKAMFNQDVKVVVGKRTPTADKRTLTADQVAVWFQVAAGGMPPPPETPTTTAPAGTPGATPEVATTGTGPAGTTPVDDTEDLVLTGSGPLEMRPAVEGEVVLADAKDMAFEAVGLGGKPVVAWEEAEGAVRSMMKGGKVLFQRAAGGVLTVVPGDYKTVEMSDPKLGTAVCRGINLVEKTGALTLAGPGQMDVQNSALRGEGAAGNEGIGMLVKWTQALEAEFVDGPDPKHPGKTTPLPRRLVLKGDADLRDAGFWMHAQTLDAALVSTGESKSPVALAHLLATGGAKVESYRSGAGAAGQIPDTLQSQRLELQTKMAPGSKIPVITRMLAEGEVTAVTYQPNKKNPDQWDAQKIATPKLIADLEPKAAGTTGSTAREALGGYAVRKLHASEGVRVELDGAYGVVPVLVQAQTLEADVKSEASSVVLEGRTTEDGGTQLVTLQQGGNRIDGLKMVLDQKAKSIDIPGAGSFVFLPPAEAGENKPNQPIRVVWATHMTYSADEQGANFTGPLATFTGPVEATLLGKPEQENKFTAQHTMRVLLAKEGEKGLGVPGNMTTGRVQEITADGNVAAFWKSFDAKGVLQTQMRVYGPSLVYAAGTKVLKIPAAGTLFVDDFRPEDAKAGGGSGKNPLLGGGEGGTPRGQTAFAWQESLTYWATSETVELKKDVIMAHVPTKPLRLSGKPAEGAAAKQKVSPVNMWCQKLTAVMAPSSKGSGTNPLALGMGNERKVSKVTAESAGGKLVRLELDNDSLEATVLEFDALNNKATADGQPARMVQEGTMTSRAARIEWDLKTGTISAIGASGIMIKP